MDFPTIISYYTKNTLYAVEIRRLIESCQKFDLKFDIEGIKSFGTWELNTTFKPFFILKKLLELKKPLLWVDADGAFLQKPTRLEAFDADLSVRMEPHVDWKHRSKVISSTIFVNYTQGALNLLEKWISNTEKQLFDLTRKKEFWDQEALRDAIFENSKKVKPLPHSYAKIFDHSIDCEEIKNPIIEHYQASRRFRNLV